MVPASSPGRAGSQFGGGGTTSSMLEEPAGAAPWAAASAAAAAAATSFAALVASAAALDAASASSPLALRSFSSAPICRSRLASWRLSRFSSVVGLGGTAGMACTAARPLPAAEEGLREDKTPWANQGKVRSRRGRLLHPAISWSLSISSTSPEVPVS